jgi:hypothetical protein
MRRGTGAIRMGVAFTLLFTSLSLVVRRQSRALEELRALDAVRSERAVLQAQRSELQREIQWLESRARVVRDAGARLGLRGATEAEMVFLSVAPPTLPAAAGPGAAAGLVSRADGN